MTEIAKPDVTTFELLVERLGKRHELVFDATGKLATDERVSHED